MLQKQKKEWTTTKTHDAEECNLILCQQEALLERQKHKAAPLMNATLLNQMKMQSLQRCFLISKRALLMFIQWSCGVLSVWETLVMYIEIAVSN